MSDLASWKFRVYGIPKPQKRARVYRGKFGKVHGVDPAESSDWKGSVALQALSTKPKEPTGKPLSMTVMFVMPVPKSASKRNPPFLHTKRPDIDNLKKCIMDALRGIYYLDDSQICEVYSRKVYASVPGVYVSLSEIESFTYDIEGLWSDGEVAS